jgi:hypothetical protein
MDWESIFFDMGRASASASINAYNFLLFYYQVDLQNYYKSRTTQSINMDKASRNYKKN